jgi:glutathione S-transferase
MSDREGKQMSKLIVYGLPFSQPVRAVVWALLLKEQPFEMKLINPGHSGKGGSRHPDYLAKNPGGTIPCIEEPDSGYTLGEAHAILTYLAQKHGWTDLYPESLQERGRIDAYLHYHHRNVRECSMLVAAKVRKDLNFSSGMQDRSRHAIAGAMKVLDQGYLASSDYLFGDHATVADLAACAEIVQLDRQYTNLYDFSPYANLSAWLKKMSQVPGYDTVHIPLATLGDISEEAPSIEVLKAANMQGFNALQGST